MTYPRVGCSVPKQHKKHETTKRQTIQRLQTQYTGASLVDTEPRALQDLLLTATEHRGLALAFCWLDGHRPFTQISITLIKIINNDNI